MHLRGWFKDTGTTIQTLARLIVYYDSQPNIGAPLITDLLANSNAGGATSALSEINLVNRERFKILRDKQILLPAVTNTSGVLTNLAYPDTTGSLAINEFIKLKGLETIYNGTNGGTIADITSGSIGFTVFSDTEGQWNFVWTSRLRYYD